MGRERKKFRNIGRRNNDIQTDEHERVKGKVEPETVE